MSGLSVDDQLHIIASGAAEILPADDLKAKLGTGRALRVKLGVDPTAPDLHLGHAVPLRKMRQFQDLGHTVVLLIGDFTSLIGDPSGRSATRPPLSRDEIEANAKTYTGQAFKILDADKTELRYNSEWLGELDFEQILKLTARFTVARMLERDDFATRYAQQRSIGLHEFLYPVMQAYDSVVLKADVELGGTDQKFNLLAGRELMREHGMEPQVALTVPILEGTDGSQKMSKSYGNYVGLEDPPEEMFGKVMSIPDEIKNPEVAAARGNMIARYFRLATSLPVAEVDAIEKGLADGLLDPNDTKRRLAREIATAYWGARAGDEAEAAFDLKFKSRGHEGLPDDIPAFEWSTMPPKGRATEKARLYLPDFLRTHEILGQPIAASGSVARSLIDEGAVRLRVDASRGFADVRDDARYQGYSLAVTPGDRYVIKVGKKRFFAIDVS